MEYYDWASQVGFYKQPLTIDGVSETGHYCYVDLITIESNSKRLAQISNALTGSVPRDFYIIGSNDGVDFTKLYDNSGVNVITNEAPAGSDGRVNIYTDVIDLGNSTVYYRIGIFVASTYGSSGFDSPNPSNAPVVVQELRLFK